MSGFESKIGLYFHLIYMKFEAFLSKNLTKKIFFILMMEDKM